MRFTSVHDRETTQQEFFERCGIVDLIEAALEGYTSTVFAFGQTGSGKTFTMSGKVAESWSGKEPPKQQARSRGDQVGLMQRAARALYREIAEREKSGVRYTVRSTFLEIYNEQVHDLIEPRAGAALAVRGSSASGFYVEDLAVVQCRGLADLEYVINRGLERRASRHHQLNQHSSRSHAVFSVYLDVTEPGASTPARYGRLSLLDLAGSENVRISQSIGGGLKEAGQINKSLFALGQVIKTLSHSARPAGTHVPYRESCLTKLLCDSLGGNAHTLMIACCSPLAAYMEESLRTLHYACSAGVIRNRPVVKLDPQQQLIARLKAEVHELKQQVQFLTHELTHAHTRLAERGDDADSANCSLPSSGHATPSRPSPMGGRASALSHHRSPLLAAGAALSSSNVAASAQPTIGPRYVSVSLDAGTLDASGDNSPSFRAPVAYADSGDNHIADRRQIGSLSDAIGLASSSTFTAPSAFTANGAFGGSNAARTAREREREAARHLDQILAGLSAQTQPATTSLRAAARAPAEYGHVSAGARPAPPRGKTPPRPARPGASGGAGGGGVSGASGSAGARGVSGASGGPGVSGVSGTYCAGGGAAPAQESGATRDSSLDPELHRWVHDLHLGAAGASGFAGVAGAVPNPWSDWSRDSARASSSSCSATAGGAAGSGMSASGAALVGRSSRERELERQLRQLSTFSLADAGGRAAGPPPVCPRPTQQPRAVGSSAHGQRRAQGSSFASVSLARDATGPISSHAGRAAELNGRRAGDHAEKGPPDARAASPGDAGAMRSIREAELERSLRELTKFSVH
jgi:hypothetical protein